MTDFQVGDRVIRIWKTATRRGVVVDRYASTPNGMGQPGPILYAVRWDGSTQAERGYVYLDPEPISVGI